MAALLYKHYLIIATGQYNKATGWLSIVDLSWGSGPNRGFYVIDNSSRSFQTKEEAEMFGVETSKTWIDERLTAA